MLLNILSFSSSISEFVPTITPCPNHNTHILLNIDHSEFRIKTKLSGFYHLVSFHHCTKLEANPSKENIDISCQRDLEMVIWRPFCMAEQHQNVCISSSSQIPSLDQIRSKSIKEKHIYCMPKKIQDGHLSTILHCR